mgnify:FL=1
MHLDGFVIPVPDEKRQAYLEMAEWFDQAMIDLGAIEVIEGWETEVPEGKRTDFRKAVQAEPGEKIVFSFILWPDKQTADAAHDAIHEDERFRAMTEMPFDGQRMIFGSFEPILNLRREP